MPTKMLRWLVRHRPEIEIVATVVMIVATEVRDAMRRRGRRRLK